MESSSLLRAEAFERLVPGRRLVFTYPVACSKTANRSNSSNSSSSSRRVVSVVVMDSSSSSSSRSQVLECAAMVVPCRKERDWIYASEGGQWQLLASAAASRFIMIFRNRIPVGERGEVREKEEQEEEEDPRERRSKKKKKKKNQNGLSRERKNVNGMSASREQGEQGCRGSLDGNGCENRRRMRRRRCARSFGEANGEQEDVEEEEGFVQFCDCENCGDEGLKKQLGPLVVALAPRSCFQASGGVQTPPIIPFVSYVDNILRQIVVEEAYSSLTGAMVVEDVALHTENNATSSSSSETDAFKDPHVQFPGFVDESLGWKAVPLPPPQLKQQLGDEEEDRYSKSVGVVWRRRLRFKRMPNLIQTEVSLNFQMLQPAGTQTSCSVDGIVHGRIRRLRYGKTDRDFHLDHSQLVHIYLAPIVAGFVLVAPALEACMELGKRVKVLALGIGGGALPIFLHKHFGFQVHAVELDEVVLDLARRHFGLTEDELMTVEVGDGTVIIDRIAMEVASTGTVAVPLIEAWQQAGCDNSADDHPPSLPSELNSDFTHKGAKSVTEHRLLDSDTLNVAACKKNCQRAAHYSGKISVLCELSDPRVHVIIVDVDEGDARLGLSSPPSSFLQCKFLMGTKIALHRGGMLAMNVVPFGETLYQGVIAALTAVFEEVYETVVEDDVNRVVFALPSAAAAGVLPVEDGPLVSLIKQLMDAQLLTRIHKLWCRNMDAGLK